MNIKEFLEKFKSFTVQDFEQLTYAMIKPDAVVAKEEILQDIERRGFKILFQQEYQLSQELAKNFYSEHAGKGFYERLVAQMTAGPVVVLILEKDGDVPCFQVWRGTLGATLILRMRQRGLWDISTLRNFSEDLKCTKKKKLRTASMGQIL